MKVGEHIEVELERIDGRGSARAQHDGRELVVPGVFAGERALVRIEALARHSNLAHARVKQQLRASPDRRALACARHEHAQVELRESGEASELGGAGEAGEASDASEPVEQRGRPGCGGCPLMALEHRAQLEQQRQCLLVEHGLELHGEIVSGDEFGYRWSSKRIVGGRRGRLWLGSRASSSGGGRAERIADMHGCVIDHPRIEAAFAAVERLGNELGVQAWRADGSGDLRYVWAKTNGEQVLLTLITGAAQSLAATELGPRLHREGLVDGVAHAVQAEQGNAIRGQPPQIVAGLASLASTLAGVQIDIGPLGFLQPNPRVAEQAYRDLVGPPPGSEVVEQPSEALAFDLYAGAGVTTRLLQARFREVVACEAYPESAAALGVPARSVEEFCRAWLDEGRPTPQLVIANPPRAGLGEQVCGLLLELDAPRVQIMSCSAKSLAEDLRRLGPRYRLLGLRGYDTLPHTAHLELVAWLARD